MSFSTFAGLSGCALLAALTAIRVAPIARLPLSLRGMAFVLFLLLALVPFWGLPPAAYIRSVSGDLSVTTLVLLFAASLKRLGGNQVLTPRGFPPLMILVVLGGVFLYPSALGLTYFDPYALGYGSKAFVALLASFSIAAALLERHLVALCLTGAALGFSLELYDSRNLWDYLIDPWLTLYALIWLCGKGVTHRPDSLR